MQSKKSAKNLDHDKKWGEYWTTEAQDYANKLNNSYHTSRLQVIRALIPDELYCAGKQILDFGCGDAVLFPEFLKAGANIQGVDISEEMIKLAQERLKSLGYDPGLVRCVNVEYLKSIPTGSLDALMSFVVMIYFTDEEEKVFYQEASRIVKPGGYLILSHSNELFDMFSLNRYTVRFFKNHFVKDPSFHSDLENLFKAKDIPENPRFYNVRENPLVYKHKLARSGFEEIRQEFFNFHFAPPPLLKERSYPSILGVKEEDRWKLMFVCSTYNSCSVRKG